MTLMTQNPSRAVWGDELDNLFEGFFRPMRRNGELASYSLPMDITERENEFVIRAEMPGVKKEDIDITLTDGVLTITGECRDEQVQREGDRVIRQERRYGKYSRSVQLGQHVNEQAVKAAYQDGILELTLAKAEAVKPKKIAVQ